LRGNRRADSLREKITKVSKLICGGPILAELTLGAVLFRVLADDNLASNNIAGAGNIPRTSEKIRTSAPAPSAITEILTFRASAVLALLPVGITLEGSS